MKQKIVISLFMAMIAFSPMAIAQTPSNPTTPPPAPTDKDQKATRAANSEALIAQIRQPENMVRKAVKRRVMRNSTGQTVPSGLDCLTVP
jgi:hypothetical protein